MFDLLGDNSGDPTESSESSNAYLPIYPLY